MKTSFKITLLVPVLMLVALYGKAYDLDDHYKYYSGFLYHFSKYVVWPPEKSEGNFIIAIVGDAPMISYLNEIAASRKLGNRTIEIRQYDINSIGDCHILFVPESLTEHLPAIVKKARSNNTLIVSESKHAAQEYGSAINLGVKDGRVRIEVSLSNANTCALKISKDLVKISEVVD
jgi:hypothetical protein